MASLPVPVRNRCSTFAFESIFFTSFVSRVALASLLALASSLALQGCDLRFARKEKTALEADPKPEAEKEEVEDVEKEEAPLASLVVSHDVADNWVRGPCHGSKYDTDKVKWLGDGTEITQAAHCLNLCHQQELNSACQFVWGNKISAENGCWGTTGAAWMLGPYNRSGEEDDEDALQGTLCWINENRQREDLRDQHNPFVHMRYREPRREVKATMQTAADRDEGSEGSLPTCPNFPSCLKAARDSKTPCMCNNGAKIIQKPSQGGNWCYACKVSCEQTGGDGPCYRCGGKARNSCRSGQSCQIESDKTPVCIDVEASSLVESDVDGLAAAVEYKKIHRGDAAHKGLHKHNQHKNHWRHGSRHQPRGASGLLPSSASEDEDVGTSEVVELGERGVAKRRARHGHRRT